MSVGSLHYTLSSFDTTITSNPDSYSLYDLQTQLQTSRLGHFDDHKDKVIRREGIALQDINPSSVPIPTVVVHGDAEDSSPDKRAGLSSPPPPRKSSKAIDENEVSVIQATSRNTAPQIGTLLSLHRREPRQGDDESLVASDGSEDDDKLSQLPEDPLLDNVVAPEYDPKKVERQMRMKERKKFYMAIVPMISMSFQMFVMGVTLVVLPFCYPNGWRLRGYFAEENLLSHYLWGPHLHVLIYILFVTTLQKEDREARKHQPLIDLMKGNATAARSLLLNYDNENLFKVFYKSVLNRHWHVTLGVTSAILAAAFGPLSSSIFSMQPRWSVDPETMTSILEMPGLNMSPNVLDLTAFLNAANYGVVNVTFGVGDPQWVRQGYTIGAIELPDISNGTVHANTIAIRHEPNCVRHDTGQMKITPLANNSGWANTVSFNGCKLEWSVENTAKDLYGVLTPQRDCSSQSTLPIPLHHLPVVFWFFTQTPQPTLDAILCSPTISIWNVIADVDLYTKKLTRILPVDSLMISSSLSFNHNFTATDQHINSTGNPILDKSLRNVSGYPMYGQAHNGLFFDWGIRDSLVLERLEGLRMILPATMYRAAKLGEGGLEGAFGDGFEGYANRVYGMYLSIMARSLYFLPTPPSSTSPSPSTLTPAPTPHPNPPRNPAPPPHPPPHHLPPPRHPPHPHLPPLPPPLPPLHPHPHQTGNRSSPGDVGVILVSGDGGGVDGVFDE
ncbi:hypothetical protein QCA50_013799 [Cerrena zonata]|uniref:Uncharacterized protein n=1 Tax=Cerrena zonata TaxID=2478898 RepID=A0AAW0FQI1_9APHY